MNLLEIKNKIFELLAGSSISDHHKRLITILLPAMNEEQLVTILDSLVEERVKMSKIKERVDRVNFKYTVMVDKLAKEKSKES